MRFLSLFFALSSFWSFNFRYSLSPLFPFRMVWKYKLLRPQQNRKRNFVAKNGACDVFGGQCAVWMNEYTDDWRLWFDISFAHFWMAVLRLWIGIEIEIHILSVEIRNLWGRLCTEYVIMLSHTKKINRIWPMSESWNGKESERGRTNESIKYQRKLLRLFKWQMDFLYELCVTCMF